MSLKNFQYDALMRSYNQKQLLHKHEQSERIAQAEEKMPRLAEIRKEIAALGLLKARIVLGFLKKYSSFPRNVQQFLHKTVILRIIWICTMTVLFARIPATSVLKNVPASKRLPLIYCIPSLISEAS